MTDHIPYEKQWCPSRYFCGTCRKVIPFASVEVQGYGGPSPRAYHQPAGPEGTAMHAVIELENDSSVAPDPKT